MPFTSGTRIGPYEIASLLGVGGMGEVYRSRDSRLGREVALKVLPSSLAGGPDRLGRFSREAQVLAALNHPSIAAIYGLEDSGGTHALVMELVDGPTLADRIKAGPIASEEALPIAKQICEALECAHERGIVHRDLKPANVKVTSEGIVKVLDFGLAKALENDVAPADIATSPTMSRLATQAGLILGTAAYMSPEQARGKSADRRSDIWSFGCVLYEMLTGKMAFNGETISDTLAGILKEQPDWASLPHGTSVRVRVLVQRCLQKDPRQRLQAIGDARISIEEVLSGAQDPIPHAQQEAVELQTPAGRRVLPWVLGGLVLGALITGVVSLAVKPQVKPHPVRRLSIALSKQESLPSTDLPDFALSQDGSVLVYSGFQNGKSQLFLRPLDQFVSTPIPGTEDASDPFFSPEGGWLGFVAGGNLRKVALGGGPVQTLCSSWRSGATWAPDGTIFFTGKAIAGISRVAAAGGKCEDLTQPDKGRGEVYHVFPEVLLGGEFVLFNISRGFSFGQSSIALLSLKTGKWETVVSTGTNPRYLPGGYLVYAQGGSLLAVSFDLSRRRVKGSPVPVVEGLMTSADTGETPFTISRDGTLAYIPSEGAQSGRNLVMVNEDGKSKVLTQSPGLYEDLDLSPDGRHVALTVEGPMWNIWTYDIPRATLTRLTLENDNRDPFWTPDGKRVIYTSFRDGKYGLYWKAIDGSSPEELLLSSNNWISASSFSPDGKELAYYDENPETGEDIWILQLEGERKPRPFVHTRFKEWFPVFSPDGRWLAYESDESGRPEVYVQQYPGPGGKWQISNEGGSRPAWSRDGRELFYRVGDKLMRVLVQTKTAFSAGSPQLVLQGSYFPSGHYYGVMPDAKQFVFIKPAEQSHAPTQINVVTNWFDELRERISATAKP